jgi:hypothetical protein
MPIHGTRRGRTSVPKHQEPEAGKAKQADAQQPDIPDAIAPPKDTFVRPQMPVSHNDALLNTDLSGVVVNKAALPKHTLSADEILAAPDDRQGELVRRYCSFLSLHAGGAVGATTSDLPAPQTLERGGAKAEISADAISLTVDGQRATIDPNKRYSRVDADALVPVAMRVIERLLTTPRGVDEQAAKLSLFLLGGDGLLTRGARQPMAAGEAFTNPKLLCWDFNGTVEKFGDGRTRGDLARTSRAMERRGATSLITTTISPEKPEQFMVDSDVQFGGYYGKNEVRPTKGNKAYLGLAAAHGISQKDAQHRMAIFGDSATDIPSDLPGTVFFHNDAMTPAPAIELLLGELDRLGAGSFQQGLDKAAGGLPKPEQAKRDVQLGDVTFDVEMRNSSNDEHDRVWVPTVCNVRLGLDQGQMIDGIRAVPSASDMDARAHFQLLLEHLAEGFDEAQVPAVLKGVDGSKGEKPAVAATRRRLEQRELEIAAGREAVGELEALLSQPLDTKALLNHVASLVALGDSEVAKALPGIVAKATALGDAAEPQMLAALDAHAQNVRAALDELAKVAVPYYAGAPGGGARARLERAIKDPVPFSPKRQERVLKALEMAKDDAVPGGREAVELMRQGLDQALQGAKEAVAQAFEERRQAQGDLDGIAGQADAAATAREATFAEIEQMLRKIAR